jgi:hypothetical protein
VPQIGSIGTKKSIDVLIASGSGLPDTVDALSAQLEFTVPGVSAAQIISQNIAPELSERSTAGKYPLVYIYCSKIVNQLREKFRTFSGNAQMVAEVRVSQDRIDEMESNLQFYADAIMHVLDGNRGDWGDGVFYGGGYEVAFTAVKHGGRNFIQTAKVSFVLEISTD